MQQDSVSSEGIELNVQFQKAIDLMSDPEQSVFITGKAGTGKSTLLDYFCKHSDNKPVILAPTGVAALNVKGQTIHSFFNFYVDVTPQKIKNKEVKPRSKKVYKTIKSIIIDEVSMLRADLLDCIDVFLRIYGPMPSEPFGGVQMIFVGDLYQLPPVVTSQERDLFREHYASPYFFSAEAFEHVDFKIIELDKVYRQKEQEFVDLLNTIRNNTVSEPELLHLNSRYLPNFKTGDDQFYISLTTTNKKSDEINEEYLDALSEKLQVSKAGVKGDFTKEYFPTAKSLKYKVGAQIMLLNNDQKRRWVNGSIGVIEGTKIDEEGEPYLRVRLQSTEQIVWVHKFRWEVFKFTTVGKNIVSEPIGTFSQFPFRLAWAVTIHKSQGKTFDNVIVDIGRGTFASGQMYVALSRCTSFEGLVLKTPIKKHHIQTDYKIGQYLTKAKYQESDPSLEIDGKVQLIHEAIRNKCSLDITYVMNDNTETQRIVIPHKLREQTYQSTVFQGLLAFCTKRQAIRTFRVDRIVKLSVAEALSS
jgi:ATP-dependent DNA helicase PIF1